MSETPVIDRLVRGIVQSACDPAAWEVSTDDYIVAELEMAGVRLRSGLPVLCSPETGRILLMGNPLRVVS